MKKEMKQTKQVKNKRRFRIRFKVILIAFLILYLLGNIIYNAINRPISNIYVSGNIYLSDWDVIEIAKLDNYPSSLFNLSKNIEKRLEENVLVSDAKVSKKHLTAVYIEVTENRPILYDQLTKKTILLDKTQINDKFDVPILVSALEEDIYNEVIKCMKEISLDVLNKMSEITYMPDDVDDERFLVTMTDGNYVYLTLNKFTAINLYNDYVKEFNNKKGILYLNSGEYFQIMEN